MNVSPLATELAAVKRHRAILKRAGELQRIQVALETIRAGSEARAMHARNIRSLYGHAEVALPSLEAYEPEVSLEFLGGLINAIFGKSKPGQTVGKLGEAYSDKRYAAIKQLEEAIEKFYLNSTWLSKQRFVAGEVPGKTISPAFVLEGKISPNLIDNLREHNRRVETLRGSLGKAFKAYDRELKEIISEANRDGRGKSIEEKEKMAEGYLKRARALKVPTQRVNLAALPTEFIGGHRLMFSANKITHTRNQSTASIADIPALDAAGVTTYAEAMRHLVIRYGDWKSRPWWMNGINDDASFFNDSEWGSSGVLDDFSSKFDNHTLGDQWGDADYAEEGDFGVIQAIDRYIDASIR